MMEKILTLLVGLLIALGGWSLSKTFELSTSQAVLLNQVDQLEFKVQMLDEKMNQMMNMDKTSFFLTRTHLDQYLLEKHTVQN